MTSQPNTVEIDISQVPEDRRNDPRFLFLLADMQRGCADPRLVRAICIHEAGHVFFLGHAGFINPSVCGPRIIYDPIKDTFDAQGSIVKFSDWDKQYVAALNSSDWLGRVAKGYAAGGVAARVLASSVDRGDGDDRENFNAVFAMIRAKIPAMTLTADWLWAEAQRAVEADLRNDKIKDAILACADGLKPELFRVS
jgi:hypothetical protein